MFELTGNHAYNVDCMELMSQVPDKYFDLAVVDPPYGGGGTERTNTTSVQSVTRTGGTWAEKYGKKS